MLIINKSKWFPRQNYSSAIKHHKNQIHGKCDFPRVWIPGMPPSITRGLFPSSYGPMCFLCSGVFLYSMPIKSSIEMKNRILYINLVLIPSFLSIHLNASRWGLRILNVDVMVNTFKLWFTILKGLQGCTRRKEN